MDTEEDTDSPADLFGVRRLFAALVAWTAVGMLFTGLFLSAEEVLTAFNIAPRLRAVLDVLTEGVSLALVLAGWGLGVVGICMLAGVRAVLRRPVVLPWTDRLFVQPR